MTFCYAAWHDELGSPRASLAHLLGAPDVVALRVPPLPGKALPMSAPDCERCEALRKEVEFQREMQLLASSVAASLADLNDHDGQVAELRRALRQEIERREKAERENAMLSYRLAELTGTLA